MYAERWSGSAWTSLGGGLGGSLSSARGSLAAIGSLEMLSLTPLAALSPLDAGRYLVADYEPDVDATADTPTGPLRVVYPATGDEPGSEPATPSVRAQGACLSRHGGAAAEVLPRCASGMPVARAIRP